MENLIKKEGYNEIRPFQVYVGGLPEDASDLEVLNTFAHIGNIQHIKLEKNSEGMSFSHKKQFTFSKINQISNKHIFLFYNTINQQNSKDCARDRLMCYLVIWTVPNKHAIKHHLSQSIR